MDERVSHRYLCDLHGVSLYQWSCERENWCATMALTLQILILAIRLEY